MSETRKRFKVDTSRLESALASRSPESARLADERRVRSASLRERMAVVHLTDPWTLAETTENLREITGLIGADIHITSDEDGQSRWSLLDDVRRATLAPLPREKILALLEAMPERIHTPLQDLFEVWVRSEQLPGIYVDEVVRDVPPEQARLMLATTADGQRLLLQVAGWLQDAPWARRQSVRILESRARWRLRRRLATLAGNQFFGRADELEKLDRFVKASVPRVLLLEATGGLGKSALIAHFLLKNQAFLPRAGFASVHLDFDDPRLDIRVFGTLLRAINEQLDATFYGFKGGTYGAFILEAASQARETFFLDLAGEADLARVGEIDSRTYSLLGAMAERFNDMATTFSEGTASGKKRLLLILDTFERAIQQGHEFASLFLETICEFLEQTQGALLIAGRGPLLLPAYKAQSPLMTRYNPETIVLGELDEASSAELLVHLGIKPLSLAEKVVESVGKSPLTLRLVARLNEKEAITEESLATDEFRAAVDDALIQGYLVGRILIHMSDPRLRSLAHPGFVLRSLDADRVFRILGDQIDPPLQSVEEAAEMLKRLSAFHDLILADASSGLRVRPEVRSSIVRLIERDRPTQVALIHKRASAYFLALGDAASLIEAAYHYASLGLDEEASLLDDGKALATLLREPLDEWSDERRAALARLVKGGAGAIQAAQRADDLGSWERAAASRIADLVAQGRMDLARGVLGERSERSATSLLRGWDEKLAEPTLESVRKVDARSRAEAMRQLREYIVNRFTRQNMMEFIEKLPTDILARIGLNEPLNFEMFLFLLIQELDRRMYLVFLFDHLARMSSQADQAEIFSLRRDILGG